MKLLITVVIALVLLTPQQRPMSAIADDLDRLAAELRTRPTTTAVHTAADVPTAFASAKCGDTIVLDAGVRYVTGEIQLPAKSCAVTVTSSATLPDRRIGPGDAALLPILASGNNGLVINGENAKGWRFVGIQFESTANGAGEVVALENAEDVSFDRVLIVGGVNGQKRAIRGNGRNISLTRSYIANIWAYGQDSQAFCAWEGAGPYTLVDNYLEAAGENVMFGGADSTSDAQIPSDILVEGNTFFKPDAWRGAGKAVKNLFELKAARRVVVRNNVFSGNWADGQNGYGWLVKSTNQDGRAPWTSTQDVLFEGNTLRNTQNGINILGYDYGFPSGQTTRVTFRGNLIQTAGIGLQLGGEIGDLTLDRNTFQNGYTFMSMYGGGVWPNTETSLTRLRAAAFAVDRLTLTNTLANHNDYGIKGDGTGMGLVALSAFVRAWTWSQNVLLGNYSYAYPPTTYSSLASVPAGVSVGR